MKMRFITFVAVMLACIPAVLADTDSADRAFSYLSRWQAETGAPGVSAAVAVDGKIVFSGGVGMADLENGLPQNGRAVHNIGSVSKTHAVVAVMQLVEQGKVRLDAEIQAYAPWFPRKQKPITVRQVLTHTSGIRHYAQGDFGTDDVMAFRHYEVFEESTRFWRNDPLVFEPGTHWMYSSYATNLMQAIVETVSGQSFERFLAEHIWRPAGMVDTQFDVPSRIVPRRGRGYVRNLATQQLENARAEDVSYKYAGGGIISTDEDLCRFGIALNSGRLLKPATLAQMYRLQIPTGISNYASTDATRSKPAMAARQGLIFVLDRDSEGRRYAGHSGSVKGTESQFTNYYDHGVVVAVHFNVEDQANLIELRKVAEALAQLYLPATSGNAG